MLRVSVLSSVPGGSVQTPAPAPTWRKLIWCVLGCVLGLQALFPQLEVGTYYLEMQVRQRVVMYTNQIPRRSQTLHVVCHARGVHFACCLPCPRVGRAPVHIRLLFPAHMCTSPLPWHLHPTADTQLTLTALHTCVCVCARVCTPSAKGREATRARHAPGHARTTERVGGPRQRLPVQGNVGGCCVAANLQQPLQLRYRQRQQLGYAQL